MTAEPDDIDQDDEPELEPVTREWGTETDEVKSDEPMLPGQSYRVLSPRLSFAVGSTFTPVPGTNIAALIKARHIEIVED